MRLLHKLRTSHQPPPICMNNIKIPKFDENNTWQCSNKGVVLRMGGALSHAQVSPWLHRHGRTDEHRLVAVSLVCTLHLRQLNVLQPLRDHRKKTPILLC